MANAVEEVDYRSLSRVPTTFGLPRKVGIGGITFALAVFQLTFSLKYVALFIAGYWAVAYAVFTYNPKLIKMLPWLWRQKQQYCPKMLGRNNGARWKVRSMFQTQKGALADEIGLDRFVTPTVFKTRAGGFGLGLSVEGSDFDGMLPQGIEEATNEIRKARSGLDTRFRVYEYLQKRRAPHIAPRQSYPSEASRQTADRRLADLRARGEKLSEINLFLFLIYEPPQIKKWFGGWMSKDRLRYEQEHEASVRLLESNATSFIASTRTSLGARIMEEPEAKAFLRTLLNPDAIHARSAHAEPAEPLARAIADTSIKPSNGVLRMGSAHLVTAIAVKTTPRHPVPAAIQRELLSLPFEFTACMEWKAWTSDQIRAFIKRNITQFDAQSVQFMAAAFHQEQTPIEHRHAKRDVLSVQKKLGDTLESVENGIQFGDWSCVVTFADTEKRDNLHELFRIFGRFDASVVEEDLNLLNAYLATVPGNNARNLNYSFLSDADAAALSYMWCADTGSRWNKHLRDEYLTVYETEDGQPYFYNGHAGDVMCVLKTGASGSGKSFDTNHEIAQAQKYAPITLIIDIGGSYRDVVEEFHGVRYQATASRGDGLRTNPFAVQDTDENREFLLRLLRLLAGTSQQPVDVQLADDLQFTRALDDLFGQEPRHRKLSNLSVGASLAQRLSRWRDGGTYAHIFDNIEDGLKLDRLTCVEFGGFDKKSDVPGILCAYLMWRFDSIVFDPDRIATLKLLVIDEAWRLMLETDMGDYMIEKNKTGRKNNLATIFITQSGLDANRAGYGEMLNELCPVKKFFANPDINPKTYQDLYGLNEVQAARVASLKPKEEMAIYRSNPDRPGRKQFKVVRLIVGNERDRLAYSTDTWATAQKLQREKQLA